MANRVLSIEIGYTYTKVCEVDFKTKNSKVYNCFSFQTPEGGLEDGYIRNTDVFADELKKEIASRNIKTKQVVFSVSSTKIANREVYIPFVKENKIEDLVKANAVDYFPVDLSSYQLSHSILETVEVEGNKQYKLLVLAAPLDMLETYYILAKKAGLSIEALDYSGNSVVSVVRGLCMEDVTMVIKVDERNSLMTVFNNGNVVLQRTVAYGAETAIDTLMELPAFGENLSYVDAMKMLRGKTCIRKTLDAMAEDEEDELNSDEKYRKARIELTESLSIMIGSIVRVIDYYNSRNSEAQIQKVLVTGLGGDFSGLSKLMSNELGLKVSVITDIGGVNLDKVVKSADNKISVGEYLACIGAAVAPLNFIPDSHNEKKKGKKLTKEKSTDSAGNAAIILLVGGVAIAAVLAIISVSGYIIANTQNKAYKAKIAELEPIEITYNAYTSAAALRADVDAMYQQTKTPNEALPDFMEELETKMPSKVNFLSFTSSAQEVQINMNVDTKEAAAVVIAELRTFDSISTVGVQQITETKDELGAVTINFSVTCTYRIETPETADPASTEPAAAPEAAETVE